MTVMRNNDIKRRDLIKGTRNARYWDYSRQIDAENRATLSWNEMY